MQQVKYSIVVPVYNGEKTIEQLCKEILDYFNSNHASYEILFIDDYSKDSTWNVLKKLKQENSLHVKIFRLAKNAGQQHATICGINNANGNFIITIDDDLQTEPKEINKLIQHQQQTDADLVYGTYEKKQHSFVRNAGSNFVIWFFNKFSSAYKNTSSFRLLKKELANTIRNSNQKNFLLDEIIGWHTANISHIHVHHQESKKGASTYSIIKLIFLTLNYIINYTVIPLRIMTYGGLIFSLINFFLVVYYLWDKYYNYVELGFTSLIVAVFFSTGLILFSLGIIGEYITRIYSKENSRPYYIIKEKEL